MYQLSNRILPDFTLVVLSSVNELTIREERIFIRCIFFVKLNYTIKYMSRDMTKPTK